MKHLLPWLWTEGNQQQIPRGYWFLETTTSLSCMRLCGSQACLHQLFNHIDLSKRYRPTQACLCSLRRLTPQRQLLDSRTYVCINNSLLQANSSLLSSEAHSKYETRIYSA